MKVIVLILSLATISGCYSTRTIVIDDVDTRGLTGKILSDGRTGKLIIPEHVDGNRYYLHELSPNGEIIFYKDKQ